MYKIDIRKKIKEEKFVEEIARALADKTGRPYENCFLFISNIAERKIKEVEETFFKVGNTKDIDISNAQSLDEFLKEKDVIKG